MINLEYVGQNIIENMIGVRKENVKVGSSIIISFEYNFSEWFVESISDKKLKELNKKHQILDISKDGITAKIFINLLFINRGGYYSCFIEDNYKTHNPLYKDKTKWLFTTNHDSCWRTSAFDDANKVISLVKDSIFEISKGSELENIFISKHIIPNFSTVKNSEIFMFDELITNESYQDREHVMITGSKKSFKKIK